MQQIENYMTNASISMVMQVHHHFKCEFSNYIIKRQIV